MDAEPQILRYAAFAATAGGGNPAGIVLDAGGLDPMDMQRIAADVGYPETAFLLGGDTDPAASGGAGRRYRIRFWSPEAEVPFCGHATVATAVVLAQRDGLGPMIFDTAAGPVELAAAEVDGETVITFTSVEPEVRDLDDEVLTRTLNLLGLRRDDLDSHHAPAEAFAGNWHPTLVLHDPEIFHQFRYPPAAVARLMAERGWTGTITVLHPAGDSDYLARNIFPVGRINEDPATGSAAAATGAYLRAIGRVPSDRTVRIHQGAHVGRPSLLTVTIPESGGVIVSGTARPL